VPNEGHFANFAQIGCHGNFVRGIGKRCTGRSSKNKYLSFGKKIMIIGPVDPEIVGHQRSLKNERKKLTQAKYTARFATLPGRLNYTVLHKNRPIFK